MIRWHRVYSPYLHGAPEYASDDLRFIITGDHGWKLACQEPEGGYVNDSRWNTLKAAKAEAERLAETEP